MGPNRKELKLRSVQCQAQRNGDPNIIQSAVLGIPRIDEFCIRKPHHEVAEVFGFQKRKPNTPMRSDEETHRSDTIKFSRSHPVKRITRARATTLPTIIKWVKTSTEQVQPSPLVGTDVRRIIAVQESRVNERA